MTERKYQMTRISAGDYLLPSNDGKTLWRICAYEEDGSAAVEEALRAEPQMETWRAEE